MSPEPEDPADPKKTRLSRRILIIGVIILLYICGGISSLFTNGNEPATQPPPPTTTAEPQTTNTRELPPPTATTAPTKTPSGESAETRAYRANIIEVANLYRTGLKGLSDQTSVVAYTPALMGSDEWKLTTAAYLAMIRVANDQTRDLNPPGPFRKIHNELLIAADHFDTMTMLYAEGVDEFNPEKLAGAAESMQLGSEAVQRATTALSNLNQP